MFFKEPDSTKGREFCLRFIVKLLGIYDDYVQNHNDESTVKEYNKKREQLMVDAIQGGGKVTSELGSMIGEKGKAVGAIISTGADLAANIYNIIKAEIDAKKAEETNNFIQIMQNQLQVKKFIDLSSLLTNVSYALYYRYRLTIEKLDNAPGTGSVIVFAHFFAFAIKQKILRKEILVTSIISDPVAILLKAIILPENDPLYQSNLFGFINKGKIILAKDSKYNDNTEWTIEGIILRSPAKIYGEVTTLRNPKSRQDNGKIEKYEPIIFYDQKEALDYGYLIPEDEKNRLAKIRTLTNPGSKSSIFKVFSCQCDAEEVKEDDLRLLVLDSDKKQSIDYIAKHVADSNINGRGRRGNGLCPYVKNLFDRPPLMLAVINDQIKTVKELLSRGANFNLRDYNDWTCMDHAVSKKHQMIATILNEYGAEQNKTSIDELNLLLNQSYGNNQNNVECKI